MKKYYFSTICLLYSILSFSQDGTLDSTYGLIYQYPGFYFKTISSYGEYNNGEGNAVAINSLGFVIIGATEEKRSSFSSPLVNSFGYHRASTDGTISDDNYSGSGNLEQCNTIITLTNGKSIIIGNRFFNNNFINSSDILMQFNNANGSLDTSIHPVTGQKTINIGFFEKISAIKEFDNKLYACGYLQITENQNPKLLVARFDLSGNLDTTFGTNGYISPTISNFDNGLDLFIQNNSKILVTGRTTNRFIITRFLNNGTLDNTFGTNGISNIDLGANGLSVPNSIIVQSDSKILISGTLNVNNSNVFNYAVVRLNENGSLDTSFASNGIFKTMVGISPSGSCSDMKLLSNGKIVLAGNLKSGNGIGLLKLNSNGTLDNSFGTNGVTTTINKNVTNVTVGKIAIKSDGKILVVGGARANAPNNKNQIFIAQYNNSSTLDNHEFTLNNISFYPNPVIETIYIPNLSSFGYEIYDLLGKIVIKGNSENQINVSSLTKGVYVLKLKDGENTINQKFIKE